MASPFDDDDDLQTGGLVAKAAPGDNAEPLSVGELSALLKRTVEDRFGYVRLRGELSGVKRAASGHLYCCLKDETARIDGVMWRGSVQRLAFEPEDGIEVIATGKLTTYPGRSSYQIVIDRLEIAGEGALLALLAKLKARLEADGLFASERKRPIPYLPRTIGVVTSPTGAVIRDILHRLRDRFPSHVLVWPVLVQGQGAAGQIAEAVRGFGALAPDGPVPRPDLIIVARGGGSIEDLWTFNEEEVVRAIAASPIPTISAVGHETDTTLADFAADLRAPTPTAAAELAVPVHGDLVYTVGDYRQRKLRSLTRQLEQARERLEGRARLLPTPADLLARAAQRLDEAAERLRRGLSDRAGKGTTQLARTAAPLRPAMLQARVARAQDQLAALARVRLTLDPDRPLARGFARVTTMQGALVKSAGEALGQAALVLKFADGDARVSIDSRASPSIPKRPVRAAKTPAPDQPKLL